MVLLKFKISWLTILIRSIFFGLIWWILTEGAVNSWWIGIPAILLALIVSIILVPPMHFAWLKLIKFMPFFVIRSLLGGTDVARRAFHPRLPIEPELVEYHTQLQLLPAQVFMLNVVSLLPGTLSAALDNNTLILHVLDKQTDYITELQAIERSVAGIFGLVKTTTNKS